MNWLCHELSLTAHVGVGGADCLLSPLCGHLHIFAEQKYIIPHSSLAKRHHLPRASFLFLRALQTVFGVLYLI
jgi:hypothetical protein